MKHRLSRMAGLVCLALMIVILSGCGQTGSIQGYVYIPQGATMDRLAGGREIPAGNKPVPGATVTCSGYRGSVTTNSAGYFRMNGVKLGTQAVVMTRPGFGTATATVNVVKGQVASINADQGMLKKKWTVLVYMDADNNLGDPTQTGGFDYALMDINEMEQVGSTNDVNVLVQWDRYASGSLGWSTTRRYYITPGNPSYDPDSNMLVDLGELRMDTPEVLKDFVIWGVTNYPADHYAVVLWNHGGGVFPRSQQRAAQRSRGICWDDSSMYVDNCLTIDDLKTAFTEAETATGKHIEVLDFDACLMNMAEVAYGLNGIFDYMVGSEESTPGTGNPYTEILANLTQNPDQSAREFAVMKAQAFADAYYAYQFGVTSSAIDVTGGKPVALANALWRFAAAVNSNTGAQDAVAMAGIDPDVERYDYYENVDIGLFMSKVINRVGDSGITSAAQDVLTALNDMVIACHNRGHAGQGLAVMMAPGRTQWLPYSDASRYPLLGFTQANQSWMNMMKSLLPPTGSATTLTINAAWDADADCDLEVLEPDGKWYSGFSLLQATNSADTFNGTYSDSAGGIDPHETFVLNTTHETGRAGYAFRVVNYSYALIHVTVTVTLNGVDHSYSYALSSGQDSLPEAITVQ